MHTFQRPRSKCVWISFPLRWLNGFTGRLKTISACMFSLFYHATPFLIEHLPILLKHLSYRCQPMVRPLTEIKRSLHGVSGARKRLRALGCLRLFWFAWSSFCQNLIQCDRSIGETKQPWHEDCQVVGLEKDEIETCWNRWCVQNMHLIRARWFAAWKIIVWLTKWHAA